jgi:epoxyqueuosine reductase QueG
LTGKIIFIFIRESDIFIAYAVFVDNSAAVLRLWQNNYSETCMEIMTMVDSPLIKEIVNIHGADLCGIVAAEEFAEAPEGFRPKDIFSACRSVVVFARRLPAGSLSAHSCVPYTHVNKLITEEVDRMTLSISSAIEEYKIRTVVIPSDDPYEHWEPENKYGQGILSLRHAGYLAGLGVLGKNTLLINREYGNMLQLGAILLDVELEPDSPANYIGCPEDSRLCIDICPQGALDGKTVDQKRCRQLSINITEKGYTLKKCNLCRSICPNVTGINS